MSSQLENTPSPLPPRPLASDQFVDDISDIGGSGSDDSADLSHVLDTVTVSDGIKDVAGMTLLHN